MPTTTDLRVLVESFARDLSQLMQRAALEEVHAKLSMAIGDIAPMRRGPGRPRKTPAAIATAAVPQKKGGKRSAADLGEMSDALLAYVKANPGQRAEQIATALGTDAGTMRLPMQKLVASKMIRTEGQKRGTQYFAGAGKAKRAARKAKRAKPGRRSKSAKRSKPAATLTLIPRRKPKVAMHVAAAAAAEPAAVEAS